MADDIRLLLAIDNNVKIDCLVFDTVYGESDGVVIPCTVDHVYGDDNCIVLMNFICYSIKLMRRISFNKIKLNNNIKLIIYSTDIDGKQVYFDNVKSISVMIYTGNIWIGSRQIDIDNIQKINDDTVEDTTDIEELKSMIVNYKEEVEALKLEVESLKDIVNAERASTYELCKKLDKDISKYKSSTRVYK